VADRPETASLVAGLAIVALGVVLLLHSSGVLELSFGAFAPAACAAAGAILLARGLTRDW
jgi:hypothetical protein